MSLFTGFVAIASIERLWCNCFCFFLPPLIIKLPFIPQNIGPPFHNGYQEIILNIDIFSFCIRPLRYLFTIAHYKKFKYKHKIIFGATIVYIYIKYFSLHGLLDTVLPIMDPAHFVLSPTLCFSYSQWWMKSTQMDAKQIHEIYQIAILVNKNHVLNFLINVIFLNIYAKKISVKDKRTTQVL